MRRAGTALVAPAGSQIRADYSGRGPNCNAANPLIFPCFPYACRRRRAPLDHRHQDLPNDKKATFQGVPRRAQSQAVAAQGCARQSRGQTSRPARRVRRDTGADCSRTRGSRSPIQPPTSDRYGRFLPRIIKVPILRHSHPRWSSRVFLQAARQAIPCSIRSWDPARR